MSRAELRFHRETLARIAVCPAGELPYRSNLSGPCLGPMHQRGIIVHQVPRDVADGEAIGPDLRHRRDLSCGAGDEAFGEIGHLLGHNGALDHLEPALLGEPDNRAARDAVEEAIGKRRMQHAVLDEEDIGAGGLGDLPPPIEHQRIGIAFALGTMLLDGADHIEAGGLALGRRGARIRPAIVRDLEAQAFGARGRIEIGAPIPGGDGEVDLGRLRRDAHLLAAAPSKRPHIAVDQSIGTHYIAAGLVDLDDGIRNLEVETLGRLVQPLAVLRELEDLTVIDALAFEHGAAIVQRMGEHMHPGVAPRDELAVHPDIAVALIVRLSGRRHLKTDSLLDQGPSGLRLTRYGPYYAPGMPCTRIAQAIAGEYQCRN